MEARTAAMYAPTYLVLLLLTFAGSTSGCKSEAEYKTCSDQFIAWQQSGNDVFLQNICGDDGAAVFVCIYEDLSCEHENPDVQQTFRTMFQNYNYNRLLACECYRNIDCLTTLQCATGFSGYVSEELHGFYAFFCDANTTSTVAKSLDCVVGNSELCPEVYNYIIPSVLIATSKRHITFGDVQQTIILTQCPKVTATDTDCMVTEALDLNSCVEDSMVNQGSISCRSTQLSAACMTEVCGETSNVGDFFQSLFGFLDCSLTIITVMCPEETVSGRTWVVTEAVQTAVIECGPGFTGSYRRYCGTDGEWGDVIDGCTPTETLSPSTTRSTTTTKSTTTTTTTKTTTTTTPTTTKTTVTTTTEKPVNLTEEVGDLDGLLDAVDTSNQEEAEEKINEIVDKLDDIAKGLQDNTQELPQTLNDTSAQTIFDAMDELLTENNTNVIGDIQKKQQDLTALAPGGIILNVMRVLTDTLQSNVCNNLQTGATAATVKDNLLVEFRRSSQDVVVFPESTVASIDTTKARIEVPSGNFRDLNDLCFVGTYFTTLGDIIPPGDSVEGSTESTTNAVVNSDVISFKLENVSGNVLDFPVNITFEPKDPALENPVCVFWDFDAKNGKGDWSAKGCSLQFYDNTTVVCSCSHLTNFCVLMSQTKISSANVKALSIISAVGCALSIVCLLLTIFVHWLVWKLVRSDRVVILMNLCVVLLLGLFLFLVGINRTESQAACKAIAAMLQFLFLTVFFLMLLTGLEILICLVHVFTTKFRIKWLLPASYFIPALIVGISLGATQGEGYGNKDFCWLDIHSGLIWAFIAPVLFVILVNFVVVLIVFQKMTSTTLLKSKSAKSKIQTSLRSLCVLLPVMGLTWVLGVVSVNQDTLVFAYLFCILNTLQGVFIFLMHCVFNIHIRNALKHRQRKRRSRASFETDLRKHSHSQSAGQDRRSSGKQRISSSSLSQSDDYYNKRSSKSPVLPSPDRLERSWTRKQSDG